MAALSPAYGEAPRNDTVSLRACAVRGRGSNLKVSIIYANVVFLRKKSC